MKVSELLAIVISLLNLIAVVVFGVIMVLKQPPPAQVTVNRKMTA